MTLEKKAEKLFESMEHFITPYDEERFIKFVKQEIKELGDKMIGEEAEYFNKEFNNKAPVRCSDDISYGKNYKRQEIINIIKEYLQ